VTTTRKINTYLLNKNLQFKTNCYRTNVETFRKLAEEAVKNAKQNGSGGKSRWVN